MPFDVDIQLLVDRLDGVVLTGGADLDPRLSGLPSFGTNGVERERDELELSLYAAAGKGGLPVLGICRGLQLINVHHGGTLSQDVPTHSRYDLGPDRAVHEVGFASSSTLESLYGVARSVNTLHHQAIQELGEGVRATAHASDGVVEGIEVGEAVLAVQWHPEMMSERDADPIFGWIVDKAAKRSAGGS